MASESEAEPPYDKAIFGSDETFTVPQPAVNQNARPPFFGNRFRPAQSWAMLCDSSAQRQTTPNTVCDYAHD